jgi:hypothetical protein
MRQVPQRISTTLKQNEKQDICRKLQPGPKRSHDTSVLSYMCICLFLVDALDCDFLRNNLCQAKTGRVRICSRPGLDRHKVTEDDDDDGGGDDDEFEQATD